MRSTILPGSFFIADPSGSFLKVNPTNEILGRVLSIKPKSPDGFPSGFPADNYSIIEIKPEDFGEPIRCFSDNSLISFEELAALDLEARRILIGIEGLLVMMS